MPKDLMEENEMLWRQVATLRAAAHQAGGVLDGALAMGHIPSANRPVVERVLGRLRAALAATDDCQDHSAPSAGRGSDMTATTETPISGRVSWPTKAAAISATRCEFAPWLAKLHRFYRASDGRWCRALRAERGEG